MNSTTELKLRILIADDDPVTRQMIGAIVKSEGLDAVMAEDGREAIKILQKDTDFAGAIFDMRMPSIEGIDIIRYMKTERRFMGIPIMMITSETDTNLVDRTFAAGATLFLPKPFSPAQLKTLLRMLVSQSISRNKNK